MIAILSISFILLTSGFIAMGMIADEQEFMRIFEVDTSYSKSIPAGGFTVYNWTIMNNDQTDNISVDVQLSIEGDGWSARVYDHSILDDLKNVSPGDLIFVKIRVNVSREKGSDSSNLTMTFIVSKNEVPVQITSVYATTTVIGAFAVSEKVLGLFDNPLPAPLDNEWGVFLLDIILWLIIAFGIAYAIDLIGNILTRRTATMLEKIIMGIIRTPLLVLIFLFGVVQSLDALHMHIPEDVRQTILSVYQVIVVIVIFYMAYKIFKKVLIYYGKVIAKRTASKLDDVLIPIVEKIGIVIIGIAAAMYALSALNIDLTMFVAGGVFLSFVIAFAAQETLSNFFSGLFILMDRPFSEGDVVILTDGDWCEVRKIGLRSTKLFRYSDASMLAIPNNKLVNDKIANFTSVPDKGRIMMTFGVSYDSDVEKVREIIRDVINDCSYIIRDKPELKPIVRFEQMADSSLNFFILAWLNDRADRFDAKDFLNTNIFKRFNEAGIEVPFPQRVVHLKEEEKKA